MVVADCLARDHEALGVAARELAALATGDWAPLHRQDDGAGELPVSDELLPMPAVGQEVLAHIGPGTWPPVATLFEELPPR